MRLSYAQGAHLQDLQPVTQGWLSLQADQQVGSASHWHHWRGCQGQRCIWGPSWDVKWGQGCRGWLGHSRRCECGCWGQASDGLSWGLCGLRGGHWGASWVEGETGVGAGCCWRWGRGRRRGLQIAFMVWGKHWLGANCCQVQAHACGMHVCTCRMAACQAAWGGLCSGQRRAIQQLRWGQPGRLR